MAKTRARAIGLVSGECANHAQGGCRGIDILSRFAIPLDRCLVAMGLPCKYFERCVLPLALRHSRYAPAGDDYDRRIRGRRQAKQQELFAGMEDEALQKRIAEHPFYGRLPREGNCHASERMCPDCGGPLRKGKRVCPECRAKRRRESYRREKARQRKNHGQVSYS